MIKADYRKVSGRVKNYNIELPGNVVGDFELPVSGDAVITNNGQTVNPSFGSIRLEPGLNRIEIRLNSF